MHYSEAVYNAVQVMNVDASGKSKIKIIEERIAATEIIYSQYGNAATYNKIAEIPVMEVILEHLKKMMMY